MPNYEYECLTCGPFTRFRAISERDEPVDCDECGGMGMRVMSTPNLSMMSPLRRMAAARNEQSQHAPRVGLKTCCEGRSCTHKKQKLGKDGKPALRGSRKRNRRPWMLGH